MQPRPIFGSFVSRWRGAVVGFLLCTSILMPAVEISHTPMVFKQGGSADKPVEFDGKGMIVDVGVNVTNHAWQKQGEVWTASARLATWEPVTPGLCTGLFIDELPLALGIDKEAQGKRAKGDQRNRYLPASALEPGQMGCTESGIVYFRWPAGKVPERSQLFIPPQTGTSAVSIDCSHIIIRNLTAMHAANDGFNIHGAHKGIRMEGIRAFSNADEGISAHDTVEMQVSKAEVAWNASYDGGVVDADNSTTSYDDCIIHDNLLGKAAAFKFFGGTHKVTNTVIYNQKLDFRLNGEGVFSQDKITNKGFASR